MTPEKSCFFISREVSKVVLDEARSEDGLEFVKRARRKAADLHEVFYNSIDKQIILDPMQSGSYETSSLIMYESITRQLQRNEEQIPLFKTDIEYHEKAALMVFSGSKIERKLVTSNSNAAFTIFIPQKFEYFLNILEQRAPFIYKEIIDKELKIEDENTLSSIRGYYDGFMPFYLKFMKMREHGESTDISTQKI